VFDACFAAIISTSIRRASGSFLHFLRSASNDHGVVIDGLHDRCANDSRVVCETADTELKRDLGHLVITWQMVAYQNARNHETVKAPKVRPPTGPRPRLGALVFSRNASSPTPRRSIPMRAQGR
jgi:hypothetical protein